VEHDSWSVGCQVADLCQRFEEARQRLGALEGTVGQAVAAVEDRRRREVEESERSAEVGQAFLMCVEVGLLCLWWLMSWCGQERARREAEEVEARRRAEEEARLLAERRTEEQERQMGQLREQAERAKASRRAAEEDKQRQVEEVRGWAG
jgi:hypothetical protein